MDMEKKLKGDGSKVANDQELIRLQSQRPTTDD
jgi:hypothetical protein